LLLAAPTKGSVALRKSAAASEGRVVMTRYQLAKIVSWADPLDTRKRLQKVVFMLQVAGCPLEADFALHHYGPYSEEVARLTDELVRVGLLEEQAINNKVGQQFRYRLTAAARERMAQLEGGEHGQALASQMAPFQEVARSLLPADLKELEVAATMLYFRRQSHDWPEAIEKTRAFKNIPEGSTLLQRAERLARKVEELSRRSAA
jgi:uncharacterized protein YwgA